MSKEGEWNKDRVQNLIRTNDLALAKAVWEIFQRQTAAEQSSQQTIEHNGRGFTGVDAEFLSEIAKKLHRYHFRMTPRQIAVVRPKMLKYWRQLLEIIEEKQTPGITVSYKMAKAKKDEKTISPQTAIAISPNRAEQADLGFGAW